MKNSEKQSACVYQVKHRVSVIVGLMFRTKSGVQGVLHQPWWKTEHSTCRRWGLIERFWLLQSENRHFWKSSFKGKFLKKFQPSLLGLETFCLDVWPDWWASTFEHHKLCLGLLRTGDGFQSQKIRFTTASSSFHHPFSTVDWLDSIETRNES